MNKKSISELILLGVFTAGIASSSAVSAVGEPGVVSESIENRESNIVEELGKLDENVVDNDNLDNETTVSNTENIGDETNLDAEVADNDASETNPAEEVTSEDSAVEGKNEIEETGEDNPSSTEAKDYAVEENKESDGKKAVAKGGISVAKGLGVAALASTGTGVTVAVAKALSEGEPEPKKPEPGKEEEEKKEEKKEEEPEKKKKEEEEEMDTLLTVVLDVAFLGLAVLYGFAIYFIVKACRYTKSNHQDGYSNSSQLNNSETGLFNSSNNS